MARKIRNLVYMWDGPFATGTSDNTISTDSIVCPEQGSMLYAWGTVVTAAGTGALNPVLSIVGQGLQDTTGAYGNRLANTITFDLDGAANTTLSAYGLAGPGEMGGFGRCSSPIGETMDIRVDYTAAADTFATTDASFNVWVLWQM